MKYVLKKIFLYFIFSLLVILCIIFCDEIMLSFLWLGSMLDIPYQISHDILDFLDLHICEIFIASYIICVYIMLWALTSCPSKNKKNLNRPKSHKVGFFCCENYVQRI